MQARRLIRIALGLALGTAAACSGGTPAVKDAGLPDAGDAGMDAGFDAGLFAVQLQLAAASQPLYSISFDEQGPFLLALFVASPKQLSCQGFSELFSQGPSTDWLLELWVPDALGTYAFGPSNSDSYPPSSGAAVAVLTDPSGRIELLPTEGQVIVTSAPADEAAQTAGTHMQGSFHIGFAANPLQPPKRCSGGEGYLPDGGIVVDPTTCLCDDWSGNQVSICDGGPGGSGASCCLSTEPAGVFADATFDALPCFVVCVAPAFSECLPLFPDGGEGFFGDGGLENPPDAGDAG